MALIPQDKLKTLIEHSEENGLRDAYVIYEAELAKLDVEQLRALLPWVHIRYADNSIIEEDELRRVMHEANWEDFIAGYQQIAGRDISSLF